MLAIAGALVISPSGCASRAAAPAPVVDPSTAAAGAEAVEPAAASALAAASAEPASASAAGAGAASSGRGDSAAAPGAASSGRGDSAAAPGAPKPPLALTYLGVAGWQLDAGDVTVLADPYFSRPNLKRPIAPDPAAIARRAPKRADLILIGHSHVDHLLDGPPLAVATGAEILGSPSTAAVARASGVAADKIITVKGGEDYAMRGYSVRVIPSLHSALDHKHTFGRPIAAAPKLPLKFSEYEEGGTFIYLVRIAGRQVLIQNTANFIERELEGIRPDIAILATGLREEIHDYTCRLLRVLGHPPLVYTNHFDNWQAPPVDEPLTEDMQAFLDEVRRCSPGTKVIVPKHFERMPAP